MATTVGEAVRHLVDANAQPVQLREDFNLYHRSVTQKLWSVDFYSRQISTLDINSFRLFPQSSSTLTSDATYVLPALDPIIEYCRHLNMLVDGFFMNCMSVLDTLAHELFALYYCPKIPSDIYIGKAHTMMKTSHCACQTKGVLDSQLVPGGWFRELERYRHCTTHESLILYDTIHLTVDPLDFSYRLSQPVKLPDNPQVRPLTYSLQRNVVDYCLSTRQNVESLVSSIYSSVLSDIHAQGNTLPVP